MTAKPDDLCVCGHVRDAHEHYRTGLDCGACGAQECPRFQPAPTPPAGWPSVTAVVGPPEVDLEEEPSA